ncbi:hypothetical protein [Streptomyces sp. cg40]|uniref:hypothetical protein n=1 Tax=Streptomyces sp. cg40 TaxID=3419764 RepID=UPI003D00F3B9
MPEHASPTLSRRGLLGASPRRGWPEQASPPWSWLTDHAIVGGVDKTWTPHTGVLEAVVGDGITAMCGAAVGGGSIMYHGTTLQPTKADFATSVPQAAALAEHSMRTIVQQDLERVF